MVGVFLLGFINVYVLFTSAHTYIIVTLRSKKLQRNLTIIMKNICLQVIWLRQTWLRLAERLVFDIFLYLNYIYLILVMMIELRLRFCNTVIHIFNYLKYVVIFG